MKVLTLVTCYLVPMCEGLGGSSGEPDGCTGPDEGDVEPEGQPMDHPRAEHVKLQRDLDTVQVRLIGRPKVDDVTLGLGHADSDVESVHLIKNPE